MKEYNRCYAEVSLGAIQNNIKEIRAHIPEGTHLYCVVKADAYGHGLVPTAQAIESLTDSFAVAEIKEAAILREAGIKKPIMILGYTSPSQYEKLVKYDIDAAVYTLEDAARLSETAAKLGKSAGIHIALDTGMTRIGFRVNEENAGKISKISGLPGIELKGIFTHLSCADMSAEEAVAYTDAQLAEYDRMLDMLEALDVDIPLKHAYNSAAIMDRKLGRYNCCRAGIIIYGMYPSTEVDASLLRLEPAMSFYAHIVNIADTEPGRSVSYGATYTTSKKVTRIATVSAGYADGYHRHRTERYVLVRGKRAPVIGRVCMDQFMIDITDIPEAEVEDTVTLFGRDGNECITAQELADTADTINYEITCSLSKRVKRIYI